MTPVNHMSPRGEGCTCWPQVAWLQVPNLPLTSLSRLLKSLCLHFLVCPVRIKWINKCKITWDSIWHTVSRSVSCCYDCDYLKKKSYPNLTHPKRNSSLNKAETRENTLWARVQVEGSAACGWFFYIKILVLASVSSVCRSVVSDSLQPMNRSTPGLPVHHQLLESTQARVHRVDDAIQPYHPLSSPSPPTLNLSQHQGLFQWVSFSHEVAKVLEFQLQPQSFQWTPRTDLL